MSNPICLEMRHGFGDAANFAHLLDLYIKRGVHYKLSTDTRLIPTFSAVENIEINNLIDGENYTREPYTNPTDDWQRYPKEIWRYSKITQLLYKSPDLFPPIFETQEECWRELCRVRLDIRPKIPSEDVSTVEAFLADYARPWILFHGWGGSDAGVKNVPMDLAPLIYRSIIDATGGTVMAVNFGKDIPRIDDANFCIPNDFISIMPWTAYALLAKVDMVVSVDSGIYHMSLLTDTPTVGMIGDQFCHPARYTMPRRNRVNVVTHRNCERANAALWADYNIVEDRSDWWLAPALIGKSVAWLGAQFK